MIFCWFLQNFRQRFGDEPPPREVLFDFLAELTLPLAGTGIFNFLLSNGECMIAHCSTELSYIVRCAPFAEAHLKDEDVTIDFNEVTTASDRVAVIATQPLTVNEDWATMQPGTLWLFHEGEVACEVKTKPSPYKTLAGMQAASDGATIDS